MKTPLLAADALILYGDGIVLIRRENSPYQGFYALPGGFVELGETVEEAVRREAREETGLDIVPIKLVGVYSSPDRDPRGHVVSVSYLAWGRGVLSAGSDASSAEVFALEALPPLAFDHALIVRDGLEKL